MKPAAKVRTRRRGRTGASQIAAKLMILRGVESASEKDTRQAVPVDPVDRLYPLSIEERCRERVRSHAS